MRLLVVHTDAHLRDEVRELLVPEGHEVLEAGDGPRALAIARERRPDVVLVQDGTGTGTGEVALLDSVKGDVDLFQIAVVVLGTAFAYDSTVALLRRGAHDVLRTPIEPAELIARIQSAERTKVLQEELGAQSRRLEDLVFGDELTGLPNRRFLLTQLSALVSGAKRHDRPLSALMVDIDHFKAVNDTFGHAAGDVVLAAVAATFRERLRGEDWVGRLGGEEFLILLPDDDAGGATVVAEQLRASIEHIGVRHEDATLRVTVSIGWATLAPADDAEALLRRADEALYDAKRAGRNATRGAASLLRRL